MGFSSFFGGWNCALPRLLCLPYHIFFSTYPPAPLPRWGRGRFFSFLMQGAPPLASPALDRLRHLQNLPSRCSAGGLAFFVACLPLPLACFPSPYPPNPLPRWGRGRPKVYFAGGTAPGTPALDRLRHLFDLPRGRGPSQTPKFLSPGPPSPWLPALLKGKPFCRFCAKLATPRAHPRLVPAWQAL